MNLVSTLLFLLCLTAQAQPMPTVQAKKAVVSSMKGGQLLASPAAKPTLAAPFVPPPTQVTLAWDFPVTLPDCYTVWSSTDLTNWTPLLTCASNQSSCSFIQSNAVMFFVIRSEQQSPPSNIITNAIISTK